MKRILTLTGTMMLCAAAALADTQQGFRGLGTSAGKIEASASSLSMELKGKGPLPARDDLKARVDALGQDLASLRATVDELDRSAAANLTPKQLKDWERIKLKVQIMGVFHEQKARMLDQEGLDGNSRKQMEQAAASIALRAKLLQKTAAKL